MKRAWLAGALLFGASCVDLEGAEREYCLAHAGICPSSPQDQVIVVSGKPEVCQVLTATVTPTGQGLRASNAQLKWIGCEDADDEDLEDCQELSAAPLAEGNTFVVPPEAVGLFIHAEVTATFDIEAQPEHTFDGSLSVPIEPAPRGPGSPLDHLTGFESGSVSGSGFLPHGFGAAVDAATHELQLTASGTAPSVRWDYPGVSTVTRLVMRATVKPVTRSGAVDLITFRDDAGNDVAFGIAPDGDWEVRGPGGLSFDGRRPASNNVAYDLDFIFDTSANPHRLYVAVDGTPLYTAPVELPFTAGLGIRTIFLGTLNAQTFEARIDDVAFASAPQDEIGQAYVVGLRPNRAGPHQQPASFSLTTGAGGPNAPLDVSNTTAWQLVDDAVFSAVDGFITQETASSGSTVSFDFEDFYAAPPAGVSMVFELGTTNPDGATFSRGEVVLGTVVELAYLSNTPIPSGRATFTRTFAPPGGSDGEWDLCALNALRSRWGASEETGTSRPVLHANLVEALIPGARP